MLQQPRLQREEDELRMQRGAISQLSLCKSFSYLLLGSSTPKVWGCRGAPWGLAKATGVKLAAGGS